ncbi:MAG: glycosyltransferase family 2 protein [Acidobacteriota bacterium]
MTHPSVAAIVLNYNGKDITLQAIASLARMTYANFEILHIDNGSNDGSTQAIAEAFPEVRTVRTESNIGPAGGLNLGLQAAIEAGYDYLLFLNNDIEADAEMLTELVRSIERSEDIGCVGPKTYYFWDRNRIWSAGGILRFREAATRERGMGKIDAGQYDREEDVDFISGCAALIRRQAVLDVGYWDPQFQLAGEDADLCMRLKNQGYRCVYVPTAKLWHMVSHTAGSYVARRTFGTGRSAALFVRRYGKLMDWLTFLPVMGAALPLAFLRELPKGNQGAVWAKAKGVLAGLRFPLQPPPSIDDTARALAPPSRS